jgi:hypothetical protein
MVPPSIEVEVKTTGATAPNWASVFTMAESKSPNEVIVKTKTVVIIIIPARLFPQSIPNKYLPPKINTDICIIPTRKETTIVPLSIEDIDTGDISILSHVLYLLSLRMVPIEKTMVYIEKNTVKPIMDCFMLSYPD